MKPLTVQSMIRTQWPQDSSESRKKKKILRCISHHHVFSGSCQTFMQSDLLVKDSCSVITGHDIKWHQCCSSWRKMCLSCRAKEKKKKGERNIMADNSTQFILKSQNKNYIPLRVCTFLYGGIRADSFAWESQVWPASFCFRQTTKNIIPLLLLIQLCQ